MKTRGQVTRFTLLLLGVVVLLNLVGTQFKFRADFTGDDRYTLSPATRDLLETLPEAVTVTAYFTEQLPPEFALTRQEFKDLLIEYAERSDGNLVFEFIDPNTDEKTEEEALQAGIRPLLVNVRDKDKAEQLKAYMGAVVKMGELTTTIPVVQPGTAMEWALSSSIKQVSVSEKPVIGLVQGHGEPSMGEITQALQGLNVLYNIQHFTFWDTLPVNDHFAALLLINPSDSFPANHLHWLDDYLARGHGVVVAYNAVSSDLGASPMADVKQGPFTQWLARHGIRVAPTVVTDAQCGQVQVMQQRGYFSIQTAMAFPYFPLISGDGFGDHPVAAGLEAVIMQFASPMDHIGDSSVTWTPILRTSAKSGALPAPVYIDAQKQWTDADFPVGHQTIGVALEGAFGPGAQAARMVVFSNGSFAVNGQGERMQQVNPDNVNLLVNAVDWISDETGLIELRNKGINYRPIEKLSDTKRNSVKWINLLLPVGFVVLYGIFRAQWRRRQRAQRMLPGHVR